MLSILKHSGKKLIYCALAASIKIKSYPWESVFKISVASPSKSVILLLESYFLKFSFATGILFSYLVVIRVSSSEYSAIRSAEKPTAQPTSKIFLGLACAIRNLRSACVSFLIMGTSPAFASLSSSSRNGVLPLSSELINAVILF